MPSVAIIGAGVSGLAAAHVLQDAGHTVTLFEKTSSVGGRATTRQRNGFTYDCGAQYIKGGNPVTDSLITGRYLLPDLIDIAKPVWIFDKEGHIQQGDPLQNADPKWNYRSGLIALPDQMAQGLHIRMKTPIYHIEQTATGWALFTTADHLLGTFNQLLITIPAPQAAELIEKCRHSIYPISDPTHTDLRKKISSTLRTASYNPLISVALGYTPTPQTRPYYALVNTDKAHPISWLAWEHEKSPERVPPNTGLLIAQMAPQYSRDFWHTSDEEIISGVAHLVANLLDEPLNTPVFKDIQRWQYALPATKADATQLNTRTLPVGLAFCGDAFVGGRVHLALEHGTIAAYQLRRQHTQK